MGACQSSENSEDEEKKKRSRMIDQKLEEDSRRLRKECKILLLGESPELPVLSCILILRRFWRKWQINDRETDEDHPPERVHKR